MKGKTRAGLVILMDENERKDWIKAGKIAADVRDYGKTLIKPDVPVLEIIEKVEAKIFQLGARPAFPAQLSLNEIAAHYTSPHDDVTLVKDSDVAKLDVGVHINGAIGDTATTLCLNKEYDVMAETAENALNEAIRIIKPGIELCDIGKAIEHIIRSAGFRPVKNLTGHEIKLYEQHAGMSIPNYDDNDHTTLKEGQVIAVEPFVTKGDGYIREGKKSGIYKLEKAENIRDNYSREVLGYIIDEYKTLPFARRWLVMEFGAVKANFAIRMLLQRGIIEEYNQLPEVSSSIVTQAEHTLLIEDKPIILTQE